VRDQIEVADVDLGPILYYFMHNLEPKGKVVALFWPMGSEIDTRPLISYLLGQKIVCALPVMREGSKELSFVRWDETQPLMPGPYGVMQPADGNLMLPDIVVVPLLSFDLQGHRMGYGGGYYDATLEFLRDRKEILAVGLAYEQQRVEHSLPAEAHDQLLDAVITPAGFYDFRA